MSAENVEIVRQAIDAFSRRDVEVAATFATTDFEWFPAMAGRVERDTYQGREGVGGYLWDVLDTWEELRLLPEEFRDLGDRVLVLGRMAGRGRGSGVPVDAPIGMVFECRAGKISSIRSFLDHGEALRAAGLQA
jgi:ketosteroid isomerase-like protein